MKRALVFLSIVTIGTVSSSIGAVPFFACTPFLACTQAFAEEKTVLSPKKEVEETIAQVLDVVTKNPGEKAREQRRTLLREVINPRFDFEEIARRALSNTWNERTVEEQKDFSKLFSDLMARTYLDKIETIEKDTVSVNEENVDGIKALVKTQINYKGDKFPIDYRLILKNNQWKVYDVIIENIGVVANYRNEFAGIIRKDGFEGMMQQLRDKVNGVK